MAYFIICFRSDFHLKQDSVQKLGIYDLSEFSAKPDSLEQKIDILFLVITRWLSEYLINQNKVAQNFIL